MDIGNDIDAVLEMLYRKINSIFGQAVDRCEGGLEEINLGNIGTNSMLNYIANRPSNLRSLRLAICSKITNEGLVSVVTKLPLLEELEVSRVCSQLELKAIGHSCPRLTTLMLHCYDYFLSSDDEGDESALAIAEIMPELRHLQLFWNGLTDTGLNAILDNCAHLQHLDLRKCYYVNLVGDLEKRCIERIKDLRHPNDSTDDIQFDFTYFEDDDFY